MNIELIDIAKRFNYQIIFKKINFQFEAEKKYAILGLNGSGKSTLLKIIAGYLSPTQGEIIYRKDKKEIVREKIFNLVNYTAPYISIPQKFTLDELFEFYVSFKSLKDGLRKKDFFEVVNLQNIEHKFIGEYSSGMKQRVKLAFCFLFDSQFVLLDEPISNLDIYGIEWYKSLVKNHLDKRLLIVASNDAKEYDFVDAVLKVEDYK